MIKYQFQVDGRGFGSPIRDLWEDAAQDLVNAGYGHWIGPEEIKMNEQASIARIKT